MLLDDPSDRAPPPLVPGGAADGRAPVPEPAATGGFPATPDDGGRTPADDDDAGRAAAPELEPAAAAGRNPDDDDDTPGFFPGSGAGVAGG
jgi:hypothetical protein